jgi:integrase
MWTHWCFVFATTSGCRQTWVKQLQNICKVTDRRAPPAGFSSVTALLAPGLATQLRSAKIVKTSLEKAGVKSAHKGAHLLRHSLATDMLELPSGRSGKVLRHRSTDTMGDLRQGSARGLEDVGRPLAKRRFQSAWPRSSWDGGLPSRRRGHAH